MTGTFCSLRRVALVGLFAAMASLPALCQNIPGSIEVTAVGGGYFGGKIYDNLKTQVDTDTTFEYGARLGVNITEGIGVEASWTYAKPDLSATRLLPDGVTGTIGSLKSNIYELDGLFSLGTDFASFYVVLGVGATTLQPELVGIVTKSNTYLSGSAGIGGKMWLGANFGLRAEARWRWVSLGHTTDAGVWCDPFGVCYGYTTSIYGHPDVTGGLTVRF
jgi:Outer membrane protein beta-barrel domain